MDESQKKKEEEKIADFQRRFAELQTEATMKISMIENDVGDLTQTAKKKVQMKY